MLELNRRARADGGVHPLVVVNLVTGIEKDPEERVTETAIDDPLEYTTGQTDVKRPVPLGHGFEVGADQLVHTVGDARRRFL